MTHVHPIHHLREQQDRYRHGEDRPLTGYLGLLATYGAMTAAATALAVRKGRLGERVRPADLALLAVTTFRISRLVTKDSVTGALRAPFTEYREPAGEGEVNEEVRGGTGWRHAVGELVTCPFCLGQWVATAATTSMVVAPRHHPLRRDDLCHGRGERPAPVRLLQDQGNGRLIAPPRHSGSAGAATGTATGR